MATFAGIIALMLAIWTLRELAIVAVPAAAAVLTALVVEPIDSALRKRLPSGFGWVGSLTAALAVLGVFVLVCGACWFAMKPALDQGQQYEDEIYAAWQSATQWAKNQGLPVDSLLDNGNLPGDVTTFLAAVGEAVWRIGGMILLAGLLLLLILLESRTWREKLFEATDRDKAEQFIEAVDSLQGKLITYLKVHTIVSLIGGVIAALWLWIMDIPFAPLWGFLFFVLNYIPNIGSIVASIPPLLMALVTGDLGHVLVVGAGLFANEQLTGNLLTSIVEGKRLMISPAVTLVALTFWTWMWGVPGAFLTLPLTVTLVIVMCYVPTLRPLALLASDTADEQQLERWQAGEPAPEQT